MQYDYHIYRMLVESKLEDARKVTFENEKHRLHKENTHNNPSTSKKPQSTPTYRVRKIG